ncbi:hypothetical protein PACILC2_07580 [Paenibacillus cisolokensis]|uniref:Uncharacterized protein n=1 Tax=Paenibacillus cisolokensis TaxID=1658519 RepID=A0ABQ4N1Z4_9BACL|nr:hypothetical protein PACILC2_07580 [Paenibacillus cisolokensis]
MRKTKKRKKSDQHRSERIERRQIRIAVQIRYIRLKRRGLVLHNLLHQEQNGFTHRRIAAFQHDRRLSIRKRQDGIQFPFLQSLLRIIRTVIENDTGAGVRKLPVQLLRHLNRTDVRSDRLAVKNKMNQRQYKQRGEKNQRHRTLVANKLANDPNGERTRSHA